MVRFSQFPATFPATIINLDYTIILKSSTMMAEESSCFPKQIKLDDYGEFAEGNLIRLIESSNLLLGSGARTSPAVSSA